MALGRNAQQASKSLHWMCIWNRPVAAVAQCWVEEGQLRCFHDVQQMQTAFLYWLPRKPTLTTIGCPSTCDECCACISPITSRLGSKCARPGQVQRR